MIEVSFEVGGHKVRPDQIVSTLERAMFEHVRAQLVAAVGAVRDPETGEKPKLRVRGRDFADLSIEVEGPPAVVEAVKKKLATMSA